MNREVLKNTFVSNGHSYANDVLQEICTKIFYSDPYKILNAPKNEPWTDEVKKHVDNMDLMVKLFNQVVSFGKEFALSFIKNNWSLYSSQPYID